MRPISWLHVSDIHMSMCDAWSQDVVLTAMCGRIEKLRGDGLAPDFILATGDLAFSGKPEEYTLVWDFFEALSKASGVPKERIFSVPGNHDIDRSRQTLCFKGARSILDSQQLVDKVLAPDDNIATLLEREQGYRRFQNEYFDNQERTPTPDGLAYVSRLVIDDIHIAIVGLDSAWVAEGGLSDHSNLLIGERQVINALTLAQNVEEPPHIVISMAHHPCHLLREFDRVVVQGRIDRGSQFFHCGHLHLPEARAVGQSATGCLMLAAGASFETRQSQNTFSVIEMDLLGARRQITTIHYDSKHGEFSSESHDKFAIEVAARNICEVGELAAELCAYRKEMRAHATYLAALILDQKAEFPIAGKDGYVFGSFAVLRAQSDSALMERTERFMAFRNVLRALYRRIPMQDILAGHGDMVSEYSTLLTELCGQDKALEQRVAGQEKEAASLAGVGPAGTFAHTVQLLDEVAEARDWPELRAHASRHVDSADTGLAVHARRMTALALAHGDTDADKAQAIELYRALGDGSEAVPTDLGNLARLLLETGDTDSAEDCVIRGIEHFPEGHAAYFAEVGHRIIEETGDRVFRERMEDALGKRGQRG
jgi:hypothetical protein